MLLDASSGGAPIIKICDFGYSKSSHLHSQPKSTVGTPAYIAPEILTRQKTYDGNQSDVWSCGVTLFVLLCGCYPFEDPASPRDFRKTMQRILAASYALPQGVALSAECQDLLRSMFELNPQKRISIPQIFSHTFYRKNLPLELDHLNRQIVAQAAARAAGGEQARREIERIVNLARSVP